MDDMPGEMSYFATHKETLSPESLSTLRIMAFLNPERIYDSLFEPLRRMFAVKNKELEFDFPTTAAAHMEACAELAEASLLQFSKTDNAYAMRPEIQTSVLADTQTVGLIPPLFNGTVKVLSGLWQPMICVPDRTVDEGGYKETTAPGTNYEIYLKKRYTEQLLPPFEEFLQYAKHNVWGRRDELVPHITRLEHIFYHFNDDMIEMCATVEFAMFLAEASWYYYERSKYHDAEGKIESALGVYDVGQTKSSLHRASIYRVHAAIAHESRRFEEAAKYVDLQVEQLELHNTAQGHALKESGLLDRAPDATCLFSWVCDVPPGIFVILPFRSVRNFGFKLYLSAQDEKDQNYHLCLSHAETCFSAALKDCINAHTKTTRMHSRIGELYYALGNVANKQVSFLGKAHLYESSECYEKALLHFQSAMTDNDHSLAGIAKTHYKLAINSIQLQDYESAIRHIDEATSFYAGDTVYDPHLARLYFQRSRIQTLTGKPDANSFLHSAFAIRGGFCPDDKRCAEELSEADFDKFVGIWER